MGKKSITRGYLAKDFERDKETIKRWLETIGIKHNEALSPSEIERFYRTHGDSTQLARLGLLVPALKQTELFSK